MVALANGEKMEVLVEWSYISLDTFISGEGRRRTATRVPHGWAIFVNQVSFQKHLVFVISTCTYTQRCSLHEAVYHIYIYTLYMYCRRNVLQRHHIHCYAYISINALIH